MNKEKYLKRLHELKMSGDLNLAHSKANNILCELLIDLGYEDIVDAYQDLYK